jgi:hypothetical protein
VRSRAFGIYRNCPEILDSVGEISICRRSPSFEQKKAPIRLLNSAIR